MSSTLFPTDAEDRALLESNPSAVIGDDVALGRVVTRLCPEFSRPTDYIVPNAINSFVVHIDLWLCATILSAHHKCSLISDTKLSQSA
jgi:hypothetical protein